MEKKRGCARVRVMLVEDDVLFQDAFLAALSAEPDMEVAGVCATVAQALRALADPTPQVLVTDLGLPDGSGIEVIQAAHKCWPDCEIMVSTTFADESHVIRSIEAGASGYLLKDSSPATIVEEIRSLLGGGSPISPFIARKVLMRFRQDPLPGSQVVPPPEREKISKVALSPRELEVLSLITKGFTYEEIAGLMVVSRHTVMTFVRRIYAKLEVKSKAEALYEARQQGLLVS